LARLAEAGRPFSNGLLAVTRILILETPHADLAELVRELREVAGESCAITLVHTAAALLENLAVGQDLLVLDYFLGDGATSGDALLARVRQIEPELPVVVVAAAGDVESAAAAIQAGAADYLVRGEQLRTRVSTQLSKIGRVLELIERNRELAHQNRLLRADRLGPFVVGESAAMRDVVRAVERVAAIPRPVVILGERGTGKEVVARAIHAVSVEARAATVRSTDDPPPLVVVNCAAFTESLLESELFGHEKGAYTGADATVPGKFEQADGGTLFLDEIGFLSLPCQQKILRVVEYGTFTRLGGTDEWHVDVRIIAATNADLQAKIAHGEFLPDLYDRLAFEVLQLPPLRERTEDISALAQRFLQRFAEEIPSFRGKRLTAGALRALKGYAFPGNVRELKNIIERAVYRSETDEIAREDLGALNAGDETPRGGTFKERIAEFERRMVLDAMADAEGNRARAARALGLSYHQYRYYLAKHAPHGKRWSAGGPTGGDGASVP